MRSRHCSSTSSSELAVRYGYDTIKLQKGRPFSKVSITYLAWEAEAGQCIQQNHTRPRLCSFCYSPEDPRNTQESTLLRRISATWADHKRGLGDVCALDVKLSRAPTQNGPTTII